MRIGIACTGRSLVENVYRRFEDAPYYLVVDTDSQDVQAVRNHCRCRPGLRGFQAAQLLADKGAEVVLSGELDGDCAALLESAGIDWLEAYPGTAQEGLAGAIAQRRGRRQGAPLVGSARVIDGEFMFTGRYIEYDDWELLLDIPTPPGTPRNWLEPCDFAHGAYHLKLVVKRMQPTSLPVDFEFAWLNKPAQEDPERVHRCSFGHYCSFSGPGTYEHLAQLSDMELTTERGEERPWDWTSAWDSAFVLIKPYGQQPYPVEVQATVTLYAEPRG